MSFFINFSKFLFLTGLKSLFNNMAKNKRVYKPKKAKEEVNDEYKRLKEEEFIFLCCCSPETLANRICDNDIKHHTVSELRTKMVKENFDYILEHKDDDDDEDIKEAVTSSFVKIELLHLVIQEELKYLNSL